MGQGIRYNTPKDYQEIVRLLGIVALLVLASTATSHSADPFRDQGNIFDPLLLNIRLSGTRVVPPANLVQETRVLDGYRLGRLGAQAPNSAIIEDDQHQRLLILSAMEDGQVKIYRLGDLPVNLTARLPAMTHRAQEKRCEQARMDPAGEVGCLALCLLESLKP